MKGSNGKNVKEKKMLGNGAVTMRGKGEGRRLKKKRTSNSKTVKEKRVSERDVAIMMKDDKKEETETNLALQL